MEKKYFTFLVLVALIVLPIFVAQAAPIAQPRPPSSNSIVDVWQLINNILDFVWPIFVGSVILMIIFSGFMFVTSAGDPGKMKLAKDALIYAIIGIVVAIFAYSAYQIINGVIGAAPAGPVVPAVPPPVN